LNRVNHPRRDPNRHEHNDQCRFFSAFKHMVKRKF